MLRKVSKKIVNKTINKNTTPLVISSMGRSGSTTLFKSMSESCIRFFKNGIRKKMSHLIRKRMWSIRQKNLESGLLYKTHDYPPNVNKCNVCRYIYTYADPFDVVASIYRKYKNSGREWFQNHSQKLKRPQANVGNLFFEDVLGLENHFDAWASADHLNILLIRYDKLWQKSDVISEFAGFSVELPKKRDRKSSLSGMDKEKENRLKKTYRRLRKKVMSKKMIKP